jgi:hypothetical protein
MRLDKRVCKYGLTKTLEDLLQPKQTVVVVRESSTAADIAAAIKATGEVGGELTVIIEEESN